MAFKVTEDKVVNLLSNSLLEIPRNQRHYVWTKTNWADILYDIKFIVDSSAKTEHFLGSIVLRSEDSIQGIEKYSIIDGQQRTITIILFLLALIRIFQEKGQDDDARGTIQYLFITDRKSNEHLILHSEFHIVLKDLATSIRANNKEKSLSQLLADIPISSLSN